MISYPTFEQVLEDLGDKFVAGMGRASGRTRRDLLEYRRTQPLWVADSTERGLAGWIHDRLWKHLVVELEDLDEVTIFDKEPTREIWVGIRYKLRVKRHGQTGTISTYPTLAARAFFSQGQEAFEGLEPIRLCAGYVWEKDERDMGETVLSLRTALERVVWVHPLPFIEEGGAGGEVRPFPIGPASEPNAPRVNYNPGLPDVSNNPGNQEDGV